MTSSQKTERLDLTEKLLVIERKKQLLQSVFRFSQMVNRLLTSVEAIGSMNVTALHLPAKIASFYRSIYGRYKHDPATRIEHNLFEIEKRVKQDFDSIIRLSKISETDFQVLYTQAIQSNDKPKFWQVVDVFKRRLQTGVSLRLILKERGISRKTIGFKLSEEQLEENITDLTIKEKCCVKNIKNQMNNLIDDVDMLFTSIDSTYAEYGSLATMRKGLLKNLAYLKSGKSIEKLPYEFEIIVEQEEDDGRDEVLVVSDDDFLIISNQVTKRLETIVGKDVRQIDVSASVAYVEKKSLFSRLWCWLNSPVGVSWKNAKKEDERQRDEF